MRYARRTQGSVRVIAVASPFARRSWVVEYVRRRYGTAPITVFFDSKGSFFNAVKRAESYPAHAFFSKTGKRIFALRGYPFPATPRSL